MRTRFLSFSLRHTFATLFIAYFALLAPAIAQNSLDVSAAEKQAEQLERERIQSERKSANQELEQRRKACYQKLAVTPCLNEARDQHSEKTRDLKRQEVALNDVQRKRAAAERVRVIEQRNSPQAQLEQAERRGKAIQATQKREESRAERQRSREAKLAQSAGSSQSQSKGEAAEGGASAAHQAQGKARKPHEPKLTPEQRADDAAKAAQRREQAIKREKDLRERQLRLTQREAQRKKPSAAGLPMPAETK